MSLYTKEEKEVLNDGFLSEITSFVKEHSGIIHGVLDLAGFILGVGETVALAKKSTKAIKGGVKAMKNMKALTKAEKMKGLFGLLRGKAQTGARKLSPKVKDSEGVISGFKERGQKAVPVR